MDRVHIKGRLLQLLAERGPQWDYDLAETIEAEYPEVSGDYWRGTVRLLLADLYSSGLIASLEEKLDSQTTGGEQKLRFRFAVTDFGRERMGHTGLIPAAAAVGGPATAEAL